MTPFEKVNLINKIIFQSLDKKAKKNGFKDWKQMQKDLNIKRWQVTFIEESMRSALNKLDSINSSNS